jgi:low affinity Fe/Cu permease
MSTSRGETKGKIEDFIGLVMHTPTTVEELIAVMETKGKRDEVLMTSAFMLDICRRLIALEGAEE